MSNITTDSPEVEWIPAPEQGVFLATGIAHYVRYAWRWPRIPDAGFLQAAANVLVQRHMMLRTCFVERNGRILASTREAARMPVETTDLRALAIDEALDTARTHISASMRLPFDTTRPPLLRLAVMVLPDQTALMILIGHHAICDAWSSAVFVSELCRLYEAAEGGSKAVLVPHLVNYREYVGAREHWLLSEEIASHLDFWRRKMQAMANPLVLRNEAESRETVSSAMQPLRCFIAGPTLQALRHLCAVERCTMFICVATALLLCLARWRPHEDPALWVVHSGRSRPEHTALIGLFSGCWMLNLHVPAAASIRAAIRQVRSNYHEALPHIHVPPPSIEAHLTSHERQGLPCTVLNFLPYRRVPGGALPLGLTRFELPPAPRLESELPFSLSIHAVEQADRLHWSIEELRGQLEEEQLQNLSESFGRVLDAMGAEADQADSSVKPANSLNADTLMAPMTEKWSAAS